MRCCAPGGSRLSQMMRRDETLIMPGWPYSVVEYSPWRAELSSAATVVWKVEVISLITHAYPPFAVVTPFCKQNGRTGRLQEKTLTSTRRPHSLTDRPRPIHRQFIHRPRRPCSIGGGFLPLFPIPDLTRINYWARESECWRGTPVPVELKERPTSLEEKRKA